MPIYTQYLTSVGNPSWNNGMPQQSGDGQVRWNLNWDDIFRMENHKYRKCRVRITLTMHSWTAGANDWANYMGYLSCNLQSLSGATSTYGTLLSLIYPQNAPTTGSSIHAMLVNTADECGVNVMTPMGNQDFTLTFRPMDLNSSVIKPIYNFQCLLYFELYDDI
jgi:hypothetical protein